MLSAKNRTMSRRLKLKAVTVMQVTSLSGVGWNIKNQVFPSFPFSFSFLSCPFPLSLLGLWELIFIDQP